MQGEPLLTLQGYFHFLDCLQPRELPLNYKGGFFWQVALLMIHGVSVVQSSVKLAAQTRAGTRRNTFPHRLSCIHVKES